MATGTEMSPRLLDTVRSAIVSYKGTVGNPLSLADVSKIARVEPITMISSSLTGNKELYNVLHGVMNIYAAYYLQAVSILSAQLADVRILKILDKTNPDRDIKTMLTSGYIAVEEFANDTLTLKNSKYALPTKGISYAKEALWDEDQGTHLGSSIQRLETFEKLGSAVGKVVEVKFKVTNTEDHKANPTETSIPVVVKLDTMIVPSDTIAAIVTSNTSEITFGSRFEAAMKGRIRGLTDFILCSDLIKQQKKTMIKDPTGAYTNLLKRVNNSRIYSALSGNISLGAVSAIVVMSDQDEEQIQRYLGGKLTNQQTRDMVFDNTSAMMLVVISEVWERVTIYVRDTNGYSQSSFDSFKGSADKGNNNIGEIMKALSSGHAPSF